MHGRHAQGSLWAELALAPSEIAQRLGCGHQDPAAGLEATGGGKSASAPQPDQLIGEHEPFAPDVVDHGMVGGCAGINPGKPRLGQQLRAMYDEVLNQGVPDRFTDLLNRLDNNGSKDGH